MNELRDGVIRPFNATTVCGHRSILEIPANLLDAGGTAGNAGAAYDRQLRMSA
jgi:hypothetical protein